MNEGHHDRKIKSGDYNGNPEEGVSQWKIYAIFLGIILVIASIYAFARWRDISSGENYNAGAGQASGQSANVSYQQQLADTTGGKTPLETLDMYINAIGKGDYELASKYFVIEDQPAELKLLSSASAEDRAGYLAILNKLTATKGVYSNNGKEYSIPVSDKNSVNLVLYPSDVWKIKSGQ